MDQSRRVKRAHVRLVIGHDGDEARREGLLDDERQAFAVREEHEAVRGVIVVGHSGIRYAASLRHIRRTTTHKRLQGPLADDDEVGVGQMLRGVEQKREALSVDQSACEECHGPVLSETKTLPRAMTRCIVHGREPLEIHSVRNAAGTGRQSIQQCTDVRFGRRSREHDVSCATKDRSTHRCIDDPLESVHRRVTVVLESDVLRQDRRPSEPTGETDGERAAGILAVMHVNNVGAADTPGQLSNGSGTPDWHGQAETRFGEIETRHAYAAVFVGGGIERNAASQPRHVHTEPPVAGEQDIGHPLDSAGMWRQIVSDLEDREWSGLTHVWGLSGAAGSAS